MPSFKPKIKIKKPMPPRAAPPDRDVKLLKKGYAELRNQYVDLVAEHGKLKERVGAVESSVGDHEDRLNNVEAPPEPTALPKAEGKCRCAKGWEGQDPDCYVHGQSFDTSDRPSKTPSRDVSPPTGDAQNAARVE